MMSDRLTNPINDSGAFTAMATAFIFSALPVRPAASIELIIHPCCSCPGKI